MAWQMPLWRLGERPRLNFVCSGGRSSCASQGLGSWERAHESRGSPRAVRISAARPSRAAVATESRGGAAGRAAAPCCISTGGARVWELGRKGSLRAAGVCQPGGAHHGQAPRGGAHRAAGCGRAPRRAHAQVGHLPSSTPTYPTSRQGCSALHSRSFTLQSAWLHTLL
jgi:hypothetical protein